MTRSLLLASAAILLVPNGAAAQPTPPRVEGAPVPVEDVPLTTDEDAEEDVDQEITVRGLRERGAVIGDIPPENQLSAADIRALGSASITELLDNIAIQTGSTRGAGAGRRWCSSTGGAPRASRSCATFRPRPSIGSTCCPKRWRSNMATGPTRGW